MGDTTYTGDTAAPRMMLHAARLSLPFPPSKVRPVSRFAFAMRHVAYLSIARMACHTALDVMQGPGCTISVATGADPFAAYFRPL